MSDLEGKYKENGDGDRKPQMQYNSLDFTVAVDRLSISRSFANGIFHYGGDNNYPRKIIQASERSSSLVTVKNKQAQFIQGLGFPGATAIDVKNGTAVVINKDGDTLYNLLQFCSIEKANINIAIHINYNALGEAVEFTPIQYDFVRKKIPLSNEKFDRFIISDIWHLENQFNNYLHRIQEFNKWINKKKEGISFEALECFAYNPDPIVVREQMELTGGIEKYPGQLFYMNRSREVYQKARYDSVADKFQFLAECDLSSLSNVQNGYAMAGIFKYPSSINNSFELNEMKRKTANTTGSINRGRILFVPYNGVDNAPQNMFEPTQMPNIDKLNEKQIERAENGIQGLYSTPNALIAKDNKSVFTSEQVEDAFDLYNAVTEPDRKELEIELTELIKNSIFASQVQLPIEIEPLKYISKNTDTNDTTDSE